MIDAAQLQHCWFITGPTASGKTAVGLELARQLAGEIVSLDSMAIYHGLDIGTAKPTAAEQALAPHWLIDLVAPDQEFSVAEYLAGAQVAVRAIVESGRTAIFVGGSPLYLKALLRGLFRGPAANWELRKQWEDEAAKHDPGWLHEQVARVDSAAAARLHVNDDRRLIRALEVFHLTGRPLSEQQLEFAQVNHAARRVFVLDWPRGHLYHRIDARVEAMFAAGWVEEVQALLSAGRELGRTARQAVGYREVLAHLAGEMSRAAAIERIQIETHRFARKQLTWYRGLEECRWFAMSEPFDPAAVAHQLRALAAE
jgi:tRNA dimethylallyltransferase